MDNNSTVTRGELVLALAMFRKLSPDNQRLAIALVEAMRECQVTSADSTVSTQQSPE